MSNTLAFETVAKDIIGNDHTITTPYGEQDLTYADWAASGRLYRPIEHKLSYDFGRFTANTHTEANACGGTMTEAYEEARHIIKQHVGANENDALIAAGSGMTAAVVLLQRMLGWRVPEQYRDQVNIDPQDKPVVFVSRMEHHSNQTSWLETIADVKIVDPTAKQAIGLTALRNLVDKYQGRPMVAAVTAASNVTGVRVDIGAVAEIMHEAGGRCFVDYTCAAPYDDINMHPDNPLGAIDATYFSPHKFLGGPGSPGILVVNKDLCQNKIPDRPGGGTVEWTNPWGGHEFSDNLEVREDGGTPPFLGMMRAALAVELKKAMGLDKIAEREEAIVNKVFADLEVVQGLNILDADRRNRLPVFALTIDGLHYNLTTRMLNDRFGIQVRGGCACAGTYGHYLFGIDREQSAAITSRISAGDLSQKPGFTRVSLHPTMSDETVSYITNALRQVAAKGTTWAEDYALLPNGNDYRHLRPAPPALDLRQAFTF